MDTVRGCMHDSHLVCHGYDKQISRYWYNNYAAAVLVKYGEAMFLYFSVTVNLCIIRSA